MSESITSDETINNDIEKIDVIEPYYPCNDPSKPLCRRYVKQGKCRSNKGCRFYHPQIITPVIKRKTTRELGHCFCGALQKRLINKRVYRIGEDDNTPTFFVVCGKTRRSMNRCFS